MKTVYVILCAILLVSVHPSLLAQNSGGIQAQVLGSFLLGLDDNPPKHSAIGGSGRFYLGSRISVEPEVLMARGFGERNRWSARGVVFTPNIAVDLNTSPRFQHYLIGGAGYTRYVSTIPNPG